MPQRWMSPEEYARLSPLEKKRLWRERNHVRAVRRHERQYRPRRQRMPYWQRKLFPMLAAIAAIPVFGWVMEWMDSAPTPLAVASPSEGQRVEFSLCHTGGGTNCVVDGDTIWFQGQNIRIAGIDAPETHESGCAEEQALGDRATVRLQELVNSGRVSLAAIDRDEDIYGRKLRIVEVGGVSVGATLVTEGLARWYGRGRKSWCE